MDNTQGQSSVPTGNGQAMGIDPKIALRARIENDFQYHAPKEGQQEKYVSLREKAKELALLYVELVPGSRELSTALTLLEESNMIANAGIARNE